MGCGEGRLDNRREPAGADTGEGAASPNDMLSSGTAVFVEMDPGLSGCGSPCRDVALGMGNGHARKSSTLDTAPPCGLEFRSSLGFSTEGDLFILISADKEALVEARAAQ